MKQQQQTNAGGPDAARPDSATSRLLQRKCECGNHTGGGSCSSCDRPRALLFRPSRQSALADAPGGAARGTSSPQGGIPAGHDFSATPLHGDAPSGASPFVQAKLSISQPGDRSEQEADRIADAVLREPAPGLGAPVAASFSRRPHGQLIQRQAGKPEGGAAPSEQEDMEGQPLTGVILQTGAAPRPAEEEEQAVQRKADDAAGGRAQAAASPAASALGGGGTPLPKDLRADMEGRFGADFSSVRLHTDGQADALCKSITARAFTHRNHIYLASEQYRPGSYAGRHLLAHELAHTIQQGASPAAERGAGRSLAPSPSSVSPSLVQRTIDTSMLGASFGLGQLNNGIPLSPCSICRDMESNALASFGSRNPVIDMSASDRWYFVNPVFTNSLHWTRSFIEANLIPAADLMIHYVTDTYRLRFIYTHTATRARQGSFTVAAGSSRTDQVTITGGAKLTIYKLELSGSASQQTTTGSTSQTTVTATNFYEHDYNVSVNYDTSIFDSNDFTVTRGFLGPQVVQVSGPHRFTGTVSVGSVTIYDDDSNPDNLTP